MHAYTLEAERMDKYLVWWYSWILFFFFLVGVVMGGRILTVCSYHPFLFDLAIKISHSLYCGDAAAYVGLSY